ncbi:MAG: protein kinase [Clostridiales bacterium]|nr:protein kinase [Clostridiales bacterium]
MNQRSGDVPFSLPDDLAAVYEVKSCLKYSVQAGTGTYLLRKRETGGLYLLKTAADPEYAAQLINEQKVLNAIHASEDSSYPKLFPAAVFLEKYPPDGEIFYIRTYIEGKTLEELCETNYEKPGIPLMQALDYMISLTDLLRFLHSMTPPLIHRDIKPQNIIVDTDGRCHYIDLGISRFYQPDKRSDTLVMGTQLTAPPEQFGYKQSDTRSDLYSLGLMLLYCLTGEYSPTDALLSELDEPIAAIIRHATMFDPDQRYQSADELLADLLAVRFPQLYPAGEVCTAGITETSDAPGHFAPLRILAVVFAGILILATAIWMNRGTFYSLFSENASGNSSESDVTSESGSDNSDSSNAIYTFTEPLIEEAVRSQLGISEEESITEKDLEQIVSLHIFGLQIYSDDEEFWFQGNYPFVYDNEMQESGLYERTGTISSLEDITHMPNLHTLCLYRQQIKDLSVLADSDLTITELGLGYNPLTDLSPLSENADIETLNLAGLGISDVSVISTLDNLKNLNISSTNIRSLAGLENCAIEELNIYDLDLADYSQLSSLEHLTSLEINHLSNAIISAVSETSLTSLFIHSANGIPISQLSEISTLETLGVIVGNMDEVSLDAINLPCLWNLDIKNATISDFSGLSSLESLTTLTIYASTCLSYDGLSDIPNLHIINCTEEQAETIRAQYPDADYYYAY